MTVRLSQSSLTGTERTDVAVGTVSEASMLLAVRAGAPRSTVNVRLVARGGPLGPRRVLRHRARWCPWPARRPSPRVAAWPRVRAPASASGPWSPARARPRSRPRLGLGLGLRSRASAPAWSLPRGLGATRWSAPLPEKYAAHVGSTRARILLVAVVHLLDQPLVGAELLGDRRGRARGAGGWVARLRHGCFRLFPLEVLDVSVRQVRRGPRHGIKASPPMPHNCSGWVTRETRRRQARLSRRTDEGLKTSADMADHKRDHDQRAEQAAPDAGGRDRRRGDVGRLRRRVGSDGDDDGSPDTGGSRATRRRRRRRGAADHDQGDGGPGHRQARRAAEGAGQGGRVRGGRRVLRRTPTSVSSRASRSTRRTPSFTGGAREDAARDADLLSNAEIADQIEQRHRHQAPGRPRRVRGQGQGAGASPPASPSTSTPPASWSAATGSRATCC